jgi:hypothetical protein
MKRVTPQQHAWLLNFFAAFYGVYGVMRRHLMFSFSTS